MEPTDHELILRFVRERSESAFSELTNRHLNLVYGTARRLVGDPETARDVAQAVFTDLARKAHRWDAATVLPAWLYRATTFSAAKARRSDQRRTQRESEAMRRHVLNASTDPEVDALLPLLDEGLARLSDPDREALILRFLSGQSLRSVGEALGVGEDAARKRVERALDRLRQIMEQSGHGVSSGTVALALGIAGSDIATPALAATITSIASATLPTMGWTLATGAGIGAILVSAALELLLTSQSREIASLRQQLQTRPPEAASVTASPAAASSDPEKELLQLRKQAESLRRNRATSGPGESTSPAPGESKVRPLLLGIDVPVPIKQLVDAGAESPQHALQSVLAATFHEDLDRLLELAPFTCGGQGPGTPASKDSPAVQEWFTPIKESRMLDGATVEVNHVLYRDPSNAVVRIRYRDIHSSNELGIDNLVMIRSETGWVLADGKTDSSASPPGGP
jgi:RNA polymerase sigma factor (sigma-70 family)